MGFLEIFNESPSEVVQGITAEEMELLPRPRVVRSEAVIDNAALGISLFIGGKARGFLSSGSAA